MYSTQRKGILGLFMIAAVAGCGSTTEETAAGESDIRELPYRQIVGVWDAVTPGRFKSVTFGTVATGANESSRRFTGSNASGLDSGSYVVDGATLRLTSSSGSETKGTFSIEGRHLFVTIDGERQELRRADETAVGAAATSAWVSSVECTTEWLPTKESRATTCNIHCSVADGVVACSSSAPFVEPPVGSDSYKMRDGFFTAKSTIGSDGTFELQFPAKISPTYPPDQEAHVHGRVEGKKIVIRDYLFLSRRNLDEAHTEFSSELTAPIE